MNDLFKNIHIRLFFVVLFIYTPSVVAMIIPVKWFYHWKENPIVMDKLVYTTCEPITWTIKRKSIINRRVKVVERIIDGSPVIDRSYDSVVSKTKDYKVVHVKWDNICLKPDTYILEGVVEIEILGFKKSYIYNSLPFYVISS